MLFVGQDQLSSGSLFAENSYPNIPIWWHAVKERLPFNKQIWNKTIPSKMLKHIHGNNILLKQNEN